VESASIAAPADTAPAPTQGGTVEFEIPLVPVEPEPTEEVAAAAPAEAAPVEPQPVTAGEAEVDLSDEWEAMVQEVVEPPPAPAEAQEAPAIAEPVHAEEAPAKIEAEAAPELEIVEVPEPVEQRAAEPTFEFVEDKAGEISAAEPVASGSQEFELELTPEPAVAHGKAEAATTEDFLSELAAEVEDMESPSAAATHAPVAAAPAAPAPVPEPTAESLNELAGVFQDFRNELGELNDEDEDLETHYNLGIAYREMGLLDEAIGEFQKVAKAVQQGKPFAYAMNCSTLLALSFMDKGEPKIASLWYQRALAVPGLDQESILALRYDLGVSLDMAGEAGAALDSFRQVYAMNIDYRDVADRIATLQKH
jgi:tetratricopeptide (TPR) repeat protein